MEEEMKSAKAPVKGKEKPKKEINNSKDKVKELKIELLKQPLKKRKIKKEIAKLLTMDNQTKLGGMK